MSSNGHEQPEKTCVRHIKERGLGHTLKASTRGAETET